MSNKDKPSSPGFIERIALRLGPGRILALLGAIFLADVFIPDILPFVDEIVLGLLTALAAVWKVRERSQDKPPPKNVTPP